MPAFMSNRHSDVLTYRPEDRILQAVRCLRQRDRGTMLDDDSLGKPMRNGGNGPKIRISI
jgi:hypothetical protein